MNTYKNEIISTFSITCLTLLVLFLPPLISLIAFLTSATALISYRALQNYDIDYKYWFSFAGQLFALIFVSLSFVTGLSFIANAMV